MIARVKKPVVDRKPALVVQRPRIYMTSFGGSPDGVLPYVNCRFLPGWGTTDFAAIADEIRRTVAAGVTSCSLYVDWLMWDNSSGRYVYTGSVRAKANLRALCSFLRNADLLKYVAFFWMPDEPCRDKKISDQDFRQCAVDMLAVAAEFQSAIGLIVIWGASYDRRPAAEIMAGQGLDEYGRGAGILDDYPELERGMTGGQFSVTVPCMYTGWGSGPTVIEQFLQRWPARCRMMCVFLYDPAQGGYSTDAGMAARVMSVANVVRLGAVPLPAPAAAQPAAPTQTADDINAPYRNSGGGQQG